MTLTKNSVLQLGVGLLLASLIFSGSFALAASNTTQIADTKDVCADVESADDTAGVDDENDAADTNDAEDSCEQVESAKLAIQVKISETKARQIAESNLTNKGKITELLLAWDEDANAVARIVYEIEFTETDGTQVDVKVDANSGVYLGLDAEDDNDGEDTTDDVVSPTNGADIQSLQMKLMSLLEQLIALLSK